MRKLILLLSIVCIVGCTSNKHIMKTEMLDFYFSQKNKNHRLMLARIGFEKYNPTFFKGKEYTECVAKGAKPITNSFGDLLLVGTGETKDISMTTK